MGVGFSAIAEGKSVSQCLGGECLNELARSCEEGGPSLGSAFVWALTPRGARTSTICSEAF